MPLTCPPTCHTEGAAIHVPLNLAVHVSQEDLSVSRHHASLVFAADGTLYLTDLDSAQARRTLSNLP